MATFNPEAMQAKAEQHVSTAYNILIHYLPKESAIIALIGACQIYVTICVHVFGVDFDPFMYVFGYVAGIFHLMLSGIIIHREKMSPLLMGAIISTSIIAASSSVCVVYYLKKADNLLLYLVNFYAILVVVMWGGTAIHLFSRYIFRPVKQYAIVADQSYSPQMRIIMPSLEHEICQGVV